MQPTVRSAAPGDAPEILRLLKALAKERGKRAPVLDEAGIAALLAGPVECLVLPSGGRLVGIAFLSPGFDPLRGAGMHLEEVFVEPDQRRHGLGRALAAAAARRCRERGGSWLEGRAGTGDSGAWAFGEHAGAKPLRLLAPMRIEGEAFEDLADTAG